MDHPILPGFIQGHAGFTRPIISIPIYSHTGIKLAICELPAIIDTTAIQNIDSQARNALREGLEDLICQPGHLVSRFRYAVSSIKASTTLWAIMGALPPARLLMMTLVSIPSSTPCRMRLAASSTMAGWSIPSTRLSNGWALA